MIIVMKQDALAEDIHDIERELTEDGMNVQRNEGVHCTVLGVIGDTGILDTDALTMRPGVERIMRVSEPFKKANKKFHPVDSVIEIGDVKIGGGNFAVIAGPCSVETKEQMEETAAAVKAAGAKLMRGGAYKPRTSPYAFQGLEKKGLELLQAARAHTGLPIVSEIVSPKHIEMFEMCVDVIQIGARNMQNFDL